MRFDLYPENRPALLHIYGAILEVLEPSEMFQPSSFRPCRMRKRLLRTRLSTRIHKMPLPSKFGAAREQLRAERPVYQCPAFNASSFSGLACRLKPIFAVVGVGSSKASHEPSNIADNMAGDGVESSPQRERQKLSCTANSRRKNSSTALTDQNAALPILTPRGNLLAVTIFSRHLAEISSRLQTASLESIDERSVAVASKVGSILACNQSF